MDSINSKEIIKLHRDFAKERNWDQFHSIKNLAMALSVETSELLEIFQWLTEEQSNNISQNLAMKTRVEDELADILIYLLRITEKLDIDLNQAAVQKMEKNTVKYPVEKAKDNAKKYTDLI